MIVVLAMTAGLATTVDLATVVLLLAMVADQAIAAGRQQIAHLAQQHNLTERVWKADHHLTVMPTQVHQLSCSQAMRLRLRHMATAQMVAMVHQITCPFASN